MISELLGTRLVAGVVCEVVLERFGQGPDPFQLRSTGWWKWPVRIVTPALLLDAPNDQTEMSTYVLIAHSLWR